MLLELKADPNHETANGWTPLLAASELGEVPRIGGGVEHVCCLVGV